MKLLCRQIIQQLTGKGVNYEKITTLTTSKRIQWSQGDIKSLIAALHFIISSSAKYEVEVDVLPQELEQLGLPRDICKAIVKEYTAHAIVIREYLTQQILHLPQVQEAQWRADYILSSSECKTVASPFVRMQWQLSKPIQLGARKGSDTFTFEMSSEKFSVLYNELKAVRAIMEDIS